MIQSVDRSSASLANHRYSPDSPETLVLAIQG